MTAIAHPHAPAIPAGRVLLLAVALVAATGLISLTASPDAGVAPSPTGFDAVVQRMPSDRFGVGALHLDDPMTKVLGMLGTPDATDPDLFGRAHVWHRDGMDFYVTEFVPGEQVSGFAVTIDGSGGPRPALDADVIVGVSTLGDVLAAWGAPAKWAAHPEDDFVVQYELCRAEAPVVVKFDQRRLDRGAGVDPALDRAVDGVLLAYADEPQGSGACARP